jgi:hypothetical protein
MLKVTDIIKDFDRQSSPLFYITMSNGKRVDALYVELNSDRGLGDDHLQEAIVRVFGTKAEAQQYAETIAHYMMLDRNLVMVEACALNKLFQRLSDLDRPAKSHFGGPLRIDFSIMPPDTHPSSIQILKAKLYPRKAPVKETANVTV